MKKFIPYLYVAFCLFSNAYGQTWIKQQNRNRSDTVLETYFWESKGGQHYAAEKIILFKSGRFSFNSQWPMGETEFSEGVYTIKNDTLVLNSDVQRFNVKIKVDYVDTLITDTSYKRLNFPKDINGNKMYNAYYFINDDTTFRKVIFPNLPFRPHEKPLLDSMYNLSVRFNFTDFGSAWIPISQNNKFIKITVLTNKDFDTYRPKVITNYKFLIKRNQMIKITEGSL